jgi:hypothetical protein
MSANPSSSDAPNEAEAEAPAEPMSRAERRAAARGKTVKSDAPSWTQGKVVGAKGTQSSRRNYSNRRSG